LYDGYDDDSIEVLGCLDNAVEWWHIGRQLSLSLALWATFVVLSPYSCWLWHHLCVNPDDGAPPAWVQWGVGTVHRKAWDARPEILLCVLQFAGSLFLVGTWTMKVHALAPVNEFVYFLEFLACMACAAHGLFGYVRTGFDKNHAATLGVLLDCLTLPSVVLQHAGAWAGGSWLTLAYLRTYHQWRAMCRLREMMVFDVLLPDMAQEGILAVRAPLCESASAPSSASRAAASCLCFLTPPSLPVPRGGGRGVHRVGHDVDA